MTGPARCALIAALLAVRAAAAQPPAAGAPPPPPPPLVEIEDERQLALALGRITNDPAIRGADPATRATAQALMIEAVKRRQARAYEQALANFLEAYAKLPSPEILLHIATTLRDLGRLADAANTYQRYLDDPGPASQREGGVREQLAELDRQLTALHVQVTPAGSDVSIDGGPFVPVGQRLVTRVRPGLHLVRVRHGGQTAELTVNGFEGETKQIDARAPGAAPAASAASPAPAARALPERVSPWLTNGTQYTADSGTGRARRTRSGYGGAEVAPVTPAFEVDGDGGLRLARPARARISPGAVGLLRIDGKLRGVAAGLGLAVARGRFEGDLLALRSQVTGAYLGLRVRLRTGMFRPYVAAGVPAFLYDDEDSTKLAVGVRGAAGLELRLDARFSVQGDLGYEHFFGLDERMFEAGVLVPTVGVIGRL